MNRTALERTVTVGQRRDVFPEGDIHGEIQDVPQNWITLRAGGVRQSGSPPFPGESESENAKQQRTEDRSVDHGDRGSTAALYEVLY